MYVKSKVALMKKIMFTGVDSNITEEQVRQSLEKLGVIDDVQIIRDGNPASPVVVVAMAISDEQAYKLTTRLTDYWHDGHMINACILLH